MADPAENKNDAPANENKIKDRPRPLSIFAHEAAKTNAVLEKTSQERGVVDTKVDTATNAYAPALEAHGLALKEAGDKRIAVRKDTVDALSAEVGASETVIAELQKKVAEERAKQARSHGALENATQELLTESRKVTKDNRTAYKAKKAELKKQISTAKQERGQVYAATGKQIRRERWNTFKRTTHEAAVFLPDLAVRFGKAAKRGAGEVIHVFHRTAKKANEGFGEPTPFSVTRDKPLNKPQAPKQ